MIWDIFKIGSTLSGVLFSIILFLIFLQKITDFLEEKLPFWTSLIFVVLFCSFLLATLIVIFDGKGKIS